MSVVSTIRPGHKIITAGKTFEVVGSMKLRGRYLYKAIDAQSRRIVSLSRDDVLEAQRDGSATVSA